MIDEWIIWMNWWIDELLNDWWMDIWMNRWIHELLNDWWMDNLDELMN